MSVNFHLSCRQTKEVVLEYASNILLSLPEYNRISRRIKILNIIISSYDESSIHAIQEF